MSAIGKSSARFEVSKLEWLNSWWIRELDLEVFVEHADEFVEAKEALGVKRWGEVLVALRDGVHKLTELESVLELLISQELKLDNEVRGFLSEESFHEVVLDSATYWLEFLKDISLEVDSDCLSEKQFKEGLKVLKKRHKSEVKTVFKTIRAAVSGSLSGYELKVLIPLISRDILVSRAEQLIEEL